MKQTSVKKTEIFNHFENWLAAFAGNRNNTKGIKKKKKVILCNINIFHNFIMKDVYIT